MEVTYNGFDFGPVRCERCDIEPVYDDTGRDLLYQRIHLAISGVLNPFLTSTGKDTTGLPAGGYKQQGDPLEFSINFLKDLLTSPRQSLLVEIDDNPVYEVPGDVNPLGVGETPLPCDLDCGPIPGPFNVKRVTGDKSADFYWEVTFAVSQCSRYCLSNRWTPTVSTDSEGLSVRTVRGTAYFRADYLYYNEMTADQFRKFIVLPCPPGMRRWSIDVTQSSDNTRVDYTVVDRQVGYGVGQLNEMNAGGGVTAIAARAGVTRIEGSVTVGVQIPETGVAAAMSRTKDTTGFGPSILGWGLIGPGILLVPKRLRDRFDAWATGAAADATAGWDATWGNRRPICRAVCRVYGTAPTLGYTPAFFGPYGKQQYINVALAIIYDRFSPLKGLNPDGSVKATMISFSATQDIGSDNAPFVEVQCDFRFLQDVGLLALASPTGAIALMNTSFTYNLSVMSLTGVGLAPGVPATLTLSPSSSTPTLPNSNNTRGGYLGELVIAALNGSPCTVPTPVGPISAGDVAPALTNPPFDTGEGLTDPESIQEPNKLL